MRQRAPAREHPQVRQYGGAKDDQVDALGRAFELLSSGMTALERCRALM